jgi:tetratricopeptide (TPR) repeat protein
MAFHPFIDMLRRNFRIRDDDSSETIRAKVADHLAKLGSDLESKLPLIHYMLDVAEPDDPIHTMDRQIRRGETFDLLRSLVVLSADKRPQVVVLEDLHWADNGTQDFLTHILDSVPRIRVLALLTFRPEYAQPIGDRTYFTRLSLQNFSEAESAQMTNAVLASKNLPDALQALVRRKAEGNPFFVEEIIKSLRETEAILMGEDGWVLGRALDQIVVPDTVQDVVASRIDRLGEEPRRALQLASIIGREFTQRLLDRITDLQQSTDDCLRDLQAIELIYEKALYPELAYMFKHALTQDVAYGSLLARQRRELHQKVGEAIEELYADRLAEHSAVLGHHFARAEQWPKAANYFEQAADHAAAAFAVPEAIALCDQAIEARDRSGAKSAPRKIAKLYEKKAELLVAVSDFRGAFEAYEQEAKLGHELANPLLEGSALAGMGLAALFLHDFEASLALSVRTIKIGSDLESPELQAAGQWNQGFVQAVTARLDESRASFEAAHGLGEAANSPFHQGLAGSFLALLDSWAGNYRAAETASRAAGAVVREAELVWPMMFTQWSRGLVLTAMGAHDPAFESFESALAVAEKLGDEIYRNRCLNSMGWLHAECGDFDGSIAFNQKGVGVSRERGDPETIANSELNLGDAFLAKGDAVLASDMFAGVHGLVNKPATSDWMKWRYSQHLFAGLGETWLVLDDPAKAEDFCNQCLDLAAPTDSRKYLARGWRLKGEIAVARRQWDDARAALEKALEFAVRIGNPTQLWKTHAARGRYFRATGGLEAMAESLSAAEDVIDRIGAALATPALRDGFARSPVLHQVRDSVAAE